MLTAAVAYLLACPVLGVLAGLLVVRRAKPRWMLTAKRDLERGRGWLNSGYTESPPTPRRRWLLNRKPDPVPLVHKSFTAADRPR